MAYRVWLRLPDVLHDVIVKRCDGLFRRKSASNASDALPVFGVPEMQSRESRQESLCTRRLTAALVYTPEARCNVGVPCCVVRSG